jgi:hypothetical protein
MQRACPPDSPQAEKAGRTLDPAIGRWWQSDPLAEVDRPFSPYNSMWASPMNYSDPNGDFAWAWAAVGGIVAGVATGFPTDWNFKAVALATVGGFVAGGFVPDLFQRLGQKTSALSSANLVFKSASDVLSRLNSVPWIQSSISLLGVNTRNPVQSVQITPRTVTIDVVRFWESSKSTLSFFTTNGIKPRVNGFF